MPPEDEVLLAEEQLLHVAVSPTTYSPGYIPESDPEKDPTDYLADRGDNDDDESSNDDEDDDDDVKEDKDDEEEEEEHSTPADSTVVALPAVDHAPSAEETDPFETDESTATPRLHHAYGVTACISIRDEPPTPFWSDTEVARLLVIPTPPPSPLSLWSSPLPQIPSPPLPSILSPLPLSPPLPVSSPPPASTPPSGTPPLLPIPAPTSSPPLMLPSDDYGAYMPEVCLPLRKRSCIAFGPRYEVGESSYPATARPTRGYRADYGFVATMDREIRHDTERYVGYRITDTWDEMLEDMLVAPATDETELGWRVTDLVTTMRQDIDEIYTRLDDAQSERQLMVGWLNMLYNDRRAHAHTALLIEREARMSREGNDFRVAGSGLQETGRDYRVAGSGLQETCTVH
ncbi:hypothetical protein Tco_1534139 [Tanacetum coccineum]